MSGIREEGVHRATQSPSPCIHPILESSLSGNTFYQNFNFWRGGRFGRAGAQPPGVLSSSPVGVSSKNLKMLTGRST